MHHQDETIKVMREQNDSEKIERRKWDEKIKKLSETDEQIAALQAIKKLQIHVLDLGVDDVPESWEEGEAEGAQHDMILLQAIADLRQEFASIQSMHVQRGQELGKQVHNLRNHIALQDKVWACPTATREG